MLEAHHLGALRLLLGDIGFLDEASEMVNYETDARYGRGAAAFVARPSSTEEVSAVVAYCVRNGIALVPQAGNTGLVGGSTPDGNGRQGVLSVDRLVGTLELDRVNRSVKVGAGVRLSNLNEKLKQSGLFFPIDIGTDPRLGGMIATNTGGSRFLRYGDVRRNTLGLTVVLADEAGTVLNLSSGLRKNNAGVDWKQLFIGTCGAFGIVTECVLNLEFLPRQSATALLVPTSFEHVSALLVAMEEMVGSHLSAFEGMSGNAMRAALDHVSSLRNPFQHGVVPEFVILAEISLSTQPCEGDRPLDAMLEEALAEIWRQTDAPLVDAFVGPPHEMWRLRHALSEGVRKSGQLIAFDLSFRRGDVMRFLAHMKTEMATTTSGITICDFGHIGDGGVHFNLVLARDDPRLADPGFEMALRERVYSIAVEQFGGSFSAEHGIGRKNQAWYDKYTAHELRELASGLKGLISPGQLGALVL